MDALLLHLRLNHFPIVLGTIGAGALLVALITQRAVFMRYAQVSLLLAAVFAPVAFFTGREAEEKVEDTWYIDKKTIHAHEEAGEMASIVLVITGILAGVTLYKDNKVTRVLLLVSALAAGGAVVRTGLLGGKIVHGNARLEQPASPATTPAPSP